ncbi:MAG: T9SS type A sorting domain-containing protein [Bacillota bacterium]
MIKSRDTVILHSGISISSKFPAKSPVYIQVMNMTGDAIISSDTIKIIPGTPAIAEKPPLEKKFTLSQNYPNPFNPSTLIQYTIPEDADISIKVYDIQGNEIAVLLNGYIKAGTYKMTFDAAKYKLSSGMYIYKLQSEGCSAVMKLLYIK